VLVASVLGRLGRDTCSFGAVTAGVSADVDGICEEAVGALSFLSCIDVREGPRGGCLDGGVDSPDGPLGVDIFRSRV
jgi:hypothetical protein